MPWCARGEPVARSRKRFPPTAPRAVRRPARDRWQVAGGLGVLRELTPRTTDYLAARGERLSARLFAAALDAAGCPAAYVDATEIVQTDGVFGGASPDLRRTERSARKALRPLLARGTVPVVPGFIGAAPDGQVATLGRGGSDLDRKST